MVSIRNIEDCQESLLTQIIHHVYTFRSETSPIDFTDAPLQTERSSCSLLLFYAISWGEITSMYVSLESV